ncbi:MAG: hypothetical protein CIT03_05850 [Methanobacterium sp.]|nr:MAG: hypothetical protein CIT03_05850 [Methanobacterium sp.]
MDNEYVLELEDVGKVYLHPSGENVALDDVSLKIPKNSFIMIYGPSGSGKSTLLKIAALIKQPSSGSVMLNKNQIDNISTKERSQLIRNNIGFILQRSNLLNYLNSLENVLLPMKNSSKEKAKDLMDYVGIENHTECPKKLSPLDQQKVALARALINKPLIILADEPTGDLNKTDSEEFIKLLQSFKNETSILMCTDNPELVKYADNGIKIRNGKIIRH